MPHFRAIAPKGEVFPAEVDHSVVGRSWNHHSDAQWEAMKSQIVRLFIEENKSADQVVTILKEDAENSFVTRYIPHFRFLQSQDSTYLRRGRS